VADIGCGNGYYMLRLLEHNPQCVIGLDPSEQFWFTFSLLQRYVCDPRLQYQLLGVEDITYYPDFFDLSLCMGVVYHQREPLTMLKQVFQSLRPGGRLILEGLTIPGDEPLALCVEDRFAQMRNVYYVPTAAAMAAWCRKVGYVNVAVFSEVELAPDEQRKTKYGPVQSLEDYLDPSDPSRTVEGYPAPLRAALVAERPG
jgi:tRNA (mo5U34)-methyltransferase